MASIAFDIRRRFQAFYWYGVVGGVVLLLGMVLAVSAPGVAFLLALIGGMMTLPYHARISLYVATTTFRSSLVFPLLGRPYFWELAAILGWSGVPITILLREYPEDSWQIIRRNRFIFIGLIIYCATLILIMAVRGVGFGALGSVTGGGRFYIQQILCSIFPLLFVINRIDHKKLVRLFQIQLILSATYIISDLAYSIFPQKLYDLLYFFELSVDARNFQHQAMTFGIRRYQSLGLVAPSIFLLLLVRYKIRDFFGRKIFWLLPLSIGVIGIGLLSGHRSVIVLPAMTVLIIAWAERFFNFKRVLVVSIVVVSLVASIYMFVPYLPLAAQRALSFLPGLDIDAQALQDARLTWLTRRALFRLGIADIPNYWLIGRGFGKSLEPAMRSKVGVIEWYYDQGTFFNGFVGLMVNTGLSGTVGMLLFLYGSLALSWRVLRYVRRYGAETPIIRVALVCAAQIFVNAFSFLFIHGNAEWAMEYFCVQTGFLLAANRFLVPVEASQPQTVDATRSSTSPSSQALPQAKPA